MMLRRISSTFKKDRKRESVNGRGEKSNAETDQDAKTQLNGKARARHPEPPEPKVNRGHVEDTFTKFAQLVHAAQRPLPTQTGNGTYVEHETHASVWEDLRSLGFKDAGTVIDLFVNATSGAPVDDKTYLMERVIQLVAALPTTSKTRKDLTDAFVDQLWGSLQHPPLSYLGDKYKYRQADGSYNNIMFPHIGAANTAYARSVPPNTIQPGALPDPGVIFDSIFARKEYTQHPNKVSSVLFYWASIIIHDCFQTDHRDFNMSQTSSYLDLSPLYGDTQADQDNIRTFKDGKLKPDCFAEERLLAFPPGCGVILIMFNRFHNYVVEQLAVINENGRFTKPSDHLPPDMVEQAWKKYDNDLFQTARLITCGLYINITLLDYLRTIVNLNRSNTTWTLDPRVEMNKIFGKDGTPRGIGNQVSAEFNLVYRWHSAISDRDDKWTREVYKEMFNKDGRDVSMQELLMGLNKWEKELSPDPTKRPFAKLKRQADGKFDDGDLVEIIADSIEDVAGAFGPNNVPTVLRAVEILGMQQARKWDCASLNEFRKFFALKPHETFEEINSDPYVADQLRHLYEHPDFVELYPGLIAEEAKVPMVPGVGIAPTFTVSRAILSDAVTLVRGDRFYTIDYNPKNLTSWGYNEVQYDLNVEQGCVFYKLFLRAFPNHFKPDSIYAHYPMTVPAENRKIMTDLRRVDQYSFDRPRFIPARVNLVSYSGVKYVLQHPNEFKVPWGDGFAFVYGERGRNFMLSGDGPLYAQRRQMMSDALYKDQWHRHVKDFYELITLKLLKQKSYKLAGVNQVDITRDIGNLSHIHFAAEMFSLSLKTEENPHGIFTEHEMYQIMAAMFITIFFDLDPAKSFPLRQATLAVTKQLGQLVETNVKTTNMTSWISGVMDKLSTNTRGPLPSYGVHMIRKLLESGLGPEEVTWAQILPTSAAMVANQAQVFTQIIDYYLSDEGRQYLPDINRLAKDGSSAAEEKLLHYAMEGIRMNGTFGLYRTAAKPIQIDDGGKTVNIKEGDKVFVSFVSPAKDPKYFPDPHKVRLDRPIDSYLHYGVGTHQCLGGEASRVALTAMLKVVGRLDNLRRAPGPQGQLKRIPREGGFYIYLDEYHRQYSPFPTTMKINWDGELPDLPKAK